MPSDVVSASTSQWPSAIFASLGLAVVGLSVDGVIVAWNPGAEALLGYAAEEVLGKTAELFAPADGYGDELAKGETIVARRDGGLVFVSMHVAKVVDADGGAMGSVVVLRDVGEERAARRALAASERRFRSLVEGSPDPILVHRGGRLVFVNGALVRLLGHDEPHAFVGRRLEELLFERDEGQRLEILATRSALEEAPTLPIEMRWRRHDDGVVIVDVVGLAIEFEGAPAGLLVARDTTLRKHMQERSTHADRLAALGTMAGSIAHELNNPLTALVERLGAARELAGGPSALSEALVEASTATDRIRDVVRGLVSVWRDDDSARATDPRAAIELAVTLTKNELFHRGDLEVDLQPTPLVAASTATLAQVLIHLVRNATQALPEPRRADSRVTIRSRTFADGRAEIVVADTGPGMTAEVRARAFDPFFTTRAPKSAGLGLSICANIVAQLRGELSLDTAPNRGAVFTLRLPAAVPAKQPSAPPAPVRSGAQRARVLIIDDDDAVRRSLARMLTKHDVVTCARGDEALALIVAGPSFDVIFCDLMMPFMSGAELFERVRATWPEVAKRMVFMTGGAFTATAREFLDQIDNLCLDKPFKPTDLRAIVERFAGDFAGLR
jgi:PAS domain S-box-containing protein